MESSSPGINIPFVTFDDVSRAPRIVFLIIIIVLAFLGSLFIIIVFIQNLKLRSVQNVFVVNVSALCIADSLVNMSLVLGALSMDTWIYGDFMCRANHFFMQVVTIEALLTLMMMSVHGYFLLRLTSRYEAWISSHRIYALVTYLWFHCLSFTIPFLTDVVQTVFQPKLYICTITPQSSQGFLYTLAVICFITPVIICIVFHAMYINLTRHINSMKETSKDGENLSQRTNGSVPVVSIGALSQYSFYLSLAWLCLQSPYIISSYLKLHDYNTDLAQPIVPWQLDALFIWMRFSFSSIFPVFTFFCNKELWQNVKEYILRRKNNAVFSGDISGISSTEQILKDSCHPEKTTSPKHFPGNNKDKIIKPFNVPVLFATSTGIRVADTKVASDMDKQSLNPSLKMLQLKGKTLDIIYSEYEYSNDMFDDTSDYDSSCEIDPYSTSQPISTRKLHEHFQRTRSLSDPEVNVRLTSDKVKQVEVRNGMSSTSGDDSGLDLSQATTSCPGSVTSKSLRLLTKHHNFKKEFVCIE